MANYKGIGLVAIRDVVRKRPPEVEAALLQILTSEDKKMYLSTLPGMLVAIEVGTRVIVSAASVLYPGQTDGVKRLGFEIADHDLKGLYRFVVKIATIPLVIKQSAALWKIYHTQGRAWTESEGDRQATFYVAEYPDLPERFREMLSGYIQGTVSLTAKKNINVAKNDGNPEQWSWKITWD